MKNKPITEVDAMKRSITELEFHIKLKSEVIDKQDYIIKAQKKYINLLESQNKDLSENLNDLKTATQYIFN